jgi:outer membrane protein
VHPYPERHRVETPFPEETACRGFSPARIRSQRLSRRRARVSAQAKAYGSLLVLIGVTAGCQAPLDHIEVALARHAAAVARLPQEQRGHLLPYGAPVRSDLADDLLPEDVLTLEEARRIAVRANPDIHAAQARLGAALARVAEARARYAPSLVFTHNSTRTFQTPASRNRLDTALQPSPALPSDTADEADLQTGNIAVTALINAIRSAPLFSVGEPVANTSSFSEHSTALTATWTVFDGFVREAQLMSSKHLHDASVYALADVERLIVHAVDTAYYQVQLAEERIRIARADEDFSREQLAVTEKLFANGRASQADVGNFKVRVLAAQATLTQAIGLRDTGRVVLAELLGIGGAQLPSALRLLSLEAETEEELATPVGEEWIAKAIANRPDLRELGRIRDSQDENVRLARGLFYPSLTVSGSWGYDRTSNLRYTPQDQSSAGAMEVRWELFTGGSRHARLREAQSRRAETAASLNRLRLTVQADVRRAIIDLADTQQQIRLQSETLNTARENRRVVRAAYGAGKETLIRLNEAQRDFIAADADLALARLRLRQAWSDLAAAAATLCGKEREGKGAGYSITPANTPPETSTPTK